MRIITISTEDKRRLVSTPVTLDGKRASVTGWANNTARIMAQHGTVEYAWPTAKRIIDERNGAFKS